MSSRSQAQWTVAGVVAAPIAQVWMALLADHPALSMEDKQVIARGDGPQPFTRTSGKAGEGRIYVTVDHKQHNIAVQGEWWYRGVHSVEPHAHGSLLVYRVYNVAPGIGWWAAQYAQGPAHARTMRAQLQDLLHTIGGHLHCDSQLVGS